MTRKISNSQKNDILFGVIQQKDSIIKKQTETIKTFDGILRLCNQAIKINKKNAEFFKRLARENCQEVEGLEDK